MSKVVMALPKGTCKQTLLGGCISLGTYVSMQLLTALLIHKGIVMQDAAYPAVCVTAGISAFAGCTYRTWKGGGGTLLSASAVITIFLSLTLLIAITAGESIAVDRGLTGVGLSMVAGGLSSVLISVWIPHNRLPRKKRKKHH